MTTPTIKHVPFSKEELKKLPSTNIQTSTMLRTKTIAVPITDYERLLETAWRYADAIERGAIRRAALGASLSSDRNIFLNMLGDEQ